MKSCLTRSQVGAKKTARQKLLSADFINHSAFPCAFPCAVSDAGLHDFYLTFNLFLSGLAVTLDACARSCPNHMHFFLMECVLLDGYASLGASCRHLHRAAYAAVSNAWWYRDTDDDGRKMPTRTEVVKTWFTALMDKGLLKLTVSLAQFSSCIDAAFLRWATLSDDIWLFFEGAHWFSLDEYRPEHARIALYVSNGVQTVLA
jgi:hypothetical protein